MFAILFFFFAEFEVIVYVMLWYSIVVGWIAPDMDLWVLFVAPAWIWRHRKYLAILSTSIFIRPHSYILFYVSPLSWWTFTWINFQYSGIAFINWWRVEDKSYCGFLVEGGYAYLFTTLYSSNPSYPSSSDPSITLYVLQLFFICHIVPISLHSSLQWENFGLLSPGTMLSPVILQSLLYIL